MSSFLRKHNQVRYIIICICSYLCTLSLGKVISLHGQAEVYWGGDYFGYNLLAVILFGVTIWLLNRFLLRDDRRLKGVSLIGGFLMALAVVYGAYAHYTNNIFGSVSENILQLLMVLGLCVLTVPVVAEIMEWLGKAANWSLAMSNNDVPEKPGKLTKIKEVFRQYPALYFVFAWVTILICYLPLFLSNWPGNFIYDGRYQLQNVIEGWYSTHHPLVHTLMMGAAYKLGQSVGNVSWGYQFYTLAQMLILTAAFAYTLLYLHKKQVRTGIQVAAWAFFALFPMNALFAISSTKDVLCAAFFLFFMVFLVRYLIDKEEFKIISYVGMVLSGVFLALFRNNALYAVLAIAVILVIFVKGWKAKGKVVLVFLAIYLLAKLINGGLIVCTNASESDTYRETLSVPLQSLARVACYRREDLTDDLYEEICLYIPEGYIANYNPYNADPIKNNANEELMRTNILNFLKLWVKVGLQFPDEYVESIVTNTMGYWYPLNQGIYVSADIALYHTLIGMGDEIDKVNYCEWASDLYLPLFWACEYRYVPLLGYSFRNAPYVWFVLLFMLWSIYKKNKENLIIGALPAFYLFTCMCGPMAALRYLYCIVVCVPLLLYLAFRSSQKE